MTKVMTDLLERLTPIINTWDPEGLIGKMGAPADEYEYEIEQVAGSEYRIHSITDGVTVVCEVFNNSFGELFGLKPGQKPGPQEGYRPDGYDGERIKQAGVEVFRAVLEHRAWLFEERRPRREAAKKGRKPKCTCSVRMASGIDLPDCPRGLATGNRYATWDDVPNDSLLPDKYEARNGHPPPKCPKCDNWAYESVPECGYCRVDTLASRMTPDE